MALPNLPQSRNEKYLAKIAGQEVELPNEPLSREEQYLDYIAKNGGGGGGYVLPTATESRLGGVKIGSGINVEEDGTISADIPTKVSDLDNDVNFISDADYVHTDNNYDDTAKGIVNGVTEALAGKQDTLTFDAIPTEDSTNPVKSGGVYSADEAIRQWTTAEAKSVSGNPITLNDGSARKAEGLVVTCNPKQNLHGYDHPWAGGAGKNKLPMTVAGIKTVNTEGSWSENAYTINGITFTILMDADNNVTGIKVTGTATGTTGFNICSSQALTGNFIINGCPSGGSNATYRIDARSANPTTVLCEEYGSGASFTGSGNVLGYIRIQSGYACPTGGLLFKPMIRLASVSDATFEPYTNECPITGLTECVVDRDGKNLFDVNDYTSLSSGVSISDDAIKVVAGNYKVARYNEVLNLSAGNYVLSFKSNITSGNIYAAMTQGGNTIFEHITNQSVYSVAFTLSESGACTFVIGSANLTPAEITIYDIQIEVGSSATAYVPYSHDTATITFGQTVYGGSVDFVSGKVTVTHKLVTLIGDEGENWEYANGYGYRQFADALEVQTPKANYFKSIPNTPYTNVLNGECAFTKQKVVNFRLDELTSKAEFVAYLSAHPLQFCYEIKNHIELTLSPAELELLKGYNYITTNGTTIALDYLPNSLLAEAENYVDEVAGMLNEATYSINGLTFDSGVTYVSGGVAKIGKLVIVNLRVSLSASIQSFFIHGLPTTTIASPNAIVLVTNNRDADIVISDNGDLGSVTEIAAGTLILNAVYITN